MLPRLSKCAGLSRPAGDDPGGATAYGQAWKHHPRPISAVLKVKPPAKVPKPNVKVKAVPKRPGGKQVGKN
jgi:hypothetical protein